VGSLEALLSFLRDMKVPVSEAGTGEVHKKDVKQAAIMKEKKFPEYALILAFDVKVNAEAKKEAKHTGVQVFSSDIIYTLFDQFKLHMESTSKTEKPKHEAVFPVWATVRRGITISNQEKTSVWCDIEGGQLRVGSPMRTLGEDTCDVGRVTEIQKDKAPIDIGYIGDRVWITVEPSTLSVARELKVGDQLCSAISAGSIETLKESCRGEMRHDDWAVLDRLKKILKIE